MSERYMLAAAMVRAYVASGWITKERAVAILDEIVAQEREAAQGSDAVLPTEGD